MKQAFLLFGLLVLTVATTHAQVSPYHFSIRADLPAQLIYCMAQDQNGRLLVGTDEGLFRYNGFHSKRITAKGSSSKEITQLVRYGDLFFATNRSGQILQLKEDRLTTVSLPGFSGDIRQMTISGKQLMLTGSKAVLTYKLPSFQLIERTEIPFADEPGVQVNHVLSYAKHFQALLNSGELVDVNEREARTIPGGKGKLLIQFNRQLVIVPPLVSSESVYTYQKGVFRNWGSVQRKGNLRVNAARVIGNRLFIMTDNGVVVYNGQLSKKPTVWFSGTAITEIFRDRAGNLWLATKGKGLLLVPSEKHEIIYEGSLMSLISGPDNTFFGGTLNGSIVQFDRNGKTMRQFTSTLNSQEAQYLYYDRTSRRLFSNTGLFSLADATAINKQDEALKGAVRLNNGGVYLAKSNGVVYIPAPNARLPLYGLADSSKLERLRSDAAKCIALDETAQQVAFCTVNGVFLHAPGKPVDEITVNGSAIDAQALVWFRGKLIIATTDNELLSVHNGKVVSKRELADGSDEFVVRRMLADQQHVYILTEQGMYRFSDFTKQPEALREPVGSDGMVMRDFTLVKGKLYILTQRGVLLLPWNEKRKPDYSLVLQAVKGSGKQRYETVNGNIQFPYDEKLIMIPFECVDLTGNHEFIIRYAVRRKGEKGYWNALPSNVEQLNLSHLSPGDYTVEFYLYDPVSGNKSALQQEQFSVLYAWYNRPLLWWSVLLVAVLLIGFTWRWTILRERRNCAAKQS